MISSSRANYLDAPVARGLPTCNKHQTPSKRVNIVIWGHKIMKTFVLGVGAQKAGTTWLHNYLSTRTDADFGIVKEYHIFDAITLPSSRAFHRKAREQARKMLGQGYKSWRDSSVLTRLAFMSNPQLYYAFFADLLNDKNIQMTGDITPSYNGLSAATLTEIKENFNRRGIRVVPVFLMRDPVNRLQSSVQMAFREKGIQPTLDQELAAMDQAHMKKIDSNRVNYAHTVGVLDEVFGDDIFYNFYENLFQDDTITSLCNFLNIPHAPGNFDLRVNVSKTKNVIDAADTARFAAGYQQVYDFCAKRFGANVPQKWHSPTVSL